MSCKQINLTEEQIRNIFINKGFLFDVGVDDTLEDILTRSRFLNENKILPSGENQLYRFFGYEVKKRVSVEKAKKAYEDRYGKARVAKEIDRPDWVRQKEAGTRTHTVLAQIMDSIYNGKGNLDAIRNSAATGDYAIKRENFDSLVRLTKEVISDIEKVQKSIDPNKKANIITEQFLVDPINDIGGALDVFVVFSDKTHARLDYKTSHSFKQDIAGNLTDELLSLNKVADNELSMTEYGRIAQKTLGVGEARMVRLIPIHMKLELKPKEKRGKFDIYTNNIASLNAGASVSKFLRPIPVSGEMTKYAGINKLLEKQWVVLGKLVDKINSKTLSGADRDRINKKISAIRKSIQRTVLDGDITDIILSTKLILNELNSRVREEELINGKPNPKYLSDQELEELTNELATYEDIINNTHKYYGDLKVENPKLYEELKDKISTLSSNAISVLEEAAQQRDQRIMKSIVQYAGKEYMDKNGNLIPLEDLNFLDRDWTRISDIAHPIFETAWGLIQSSLYDMRQDTRQMADEIQRVEKGVFEYAKANNISRLDAFKLIIDTTKGSLIHMVSKELLDSISEAYYSTDLVDAAKELKSIFEIKDLKAFKENYEERFKKFKETQIHKYAEGESSRGYQQDIKNWIAQNDLNSSNEAWTNTFNRKFLKIKGSVEEANYSPEYKKILNNKALLDYYNMYRKYNNLFRDMLDISKYSDLPPEFIASIRKTMVDQISTNNLGLKAVGMATREFFESLNVRDEDTFISDVDASGELKRTIPVLFMNPFLNKDGEVDNTRRSYDLSKNLIIFGKMAYNYKHMSEIEPKILQLRGILGRPSAETAGTKVTNSAGNAIKGRITEYATKAGLTTDTYQALVDLTDMYLYGIKFKDVKNKKITKFIMKAKSIYGKQTLGLAIIPGASAYVAGEIASYFEGKKGISYTDKNVWQAANHLVNDHKKYTALALFFDPYASDALERLADNESASFLSRIMTYRNLMYPLAKADELMNDDILNRMACNWGFDIDNKLGRGKNALIRLNDPTYSVEQMKDIKSIWDLTTLDEKTGKMTIKGLTDVQAEFKKNNFIAFRNAVKATSSNIIGSMSLEDKARYETNLLYEVMMQYKSWMPGIVRERTGKLIFDDKIQAARWGRYRAAFKEWGVDEAGLEDGYRWQQYVSKVFAPNLGKLVLDLMTFGIAPKIGLIGETYIDPSGRERKVRTNIARARRMYMNYINKNPHLLGKMSFEHYLEVKEGQMRAALVEMRAIISIMITIGILGGGGGDDKKKPLYMANWGTRLLFKNLTKAQSELTFMWSPVQLTQLVQNPFPLTGILVKSLKTLTNGLDESRDLLFGENSLSDNTPMGYFLLQWIYGGGQIARFLELYKQFEKSPYLINTVR